MFYFLTFFFFNLFYVSERFVCMDVCALHACSATWRPEGIRSPGTGVTCSWSSWGAGNRNRSSRRAVSAPHHWATSLALPCFVRNWNSCVCISSQWEVRSLAYFLDFCGALFLYFFILSSFLLKVVLTFRTILCVFSSIFLQIISRRRCHIKKLISCISLENPWCSFPLRVHVCLLSYTMDSGSLHVVRD